MAGSNTDKSSSAKQRSLANLKAPWKPGQSGNPNGRPKISEEIREILQAGTPKAARKLVALISSKDQGIALKAALTVLEKSGVGDIAESGKNAPVTINILQMDGNDRDNSTEQLASPTISIASMESLTN